VDFWAVWCGPCKAIAPMVDALADEYKGKLKVAKMDIDRHQIVPQQYSIRSIPTLLLFKNGKVVSQLVGTMARPKLEAEIKKHL
jgi:thioredoxin 1